MRWESAQALKSEFLERVAQEVAAGPTASDAPGSPAGAVAGSLGAAPGAPVAVGVVPSERRDGYKIGLRLPDEGWAGSRVVRGLLEQAGAEADARVVGVIRPLSAPATPRPLQTRCRPLLLGCSVGHVRVTAGTLGCFVALADAPGVAMLSNSHVLGDSGKGRTGDAVLQPGLADGGVAPDDRVATLHADAPLSAERANQADVAVATLDDEADAGANQVPEGALLGVTDEPPDDQALAKVGRTTGHTQGTITLLEVDGLTVDYGGVRYSCNDAIEVEGVGSTPFSEGGDSGSVVYTRDLRGFGLLFAGSESGGGNNQGLTYANSLSGAMALVRATLIV